jgi:hypothetical protein
MEYLGQSAWLQFFQDKKDELKTTDLIALKKHIKYLSMMLSFNPALVGNGGYVFPKVQQRQVFEVAEKIAEQDYLWSDATKITIFRRVGPLENVDGSFANKIIKIFTHGVILLSLSKDLKQNEQNGFKLIPAHVAKDRMVKLERKRLTMLREGIIDVQEVAEEKCTNEECSNIGLYLCKSCMYAIYCCASCQKQDWKIHKPFCLRLRSFTEDLPTDTFKHDDREFLKQYNRW